MQRPIELLKAEQAFTASLAMSTIKNGRSFGIVSACLGNLSTRINAERHANLKARVNALGYRFCEMLGGYVETSEDGTPREVTELSLFIFDIDRFDILTLAIQCEQDAFIICDEISFELISAKSIKDEYPTLVEFERGEILTGNECNLECWSQIVGSDVKFSFAVI
jgi:hypothetical protein